MGSIVLIHGFLGGPASWSEVERHLPAPALEAVRKVALPGHGSPPSRSPASSFDALIQDLARSLEELDEAEGVVAGYSMGARVALHLALRVPHRIRAALLLGVDPGLEDPLQRRERRRWEERLQAMLREHGMTRFVAEWEALPLFASQRELSPDDQERQRRIRLDHDPLALAAALDVVGLGQMPSAWPALRGLSSPLLRVLAGAKDPKFVEMGRRIAALAPAASFEEVPGAGHNLILEAPERVAQELRALLEAKPSGWTREIVLGDEEQVQIAEGLALAAAHFHEESYERGGHTLEGLTCSLWLTQREGRAARHIRAHAGQSFETPRCGIEIVEVARSDGRAFVRLRVAPTKPRMGR